MKTLKLTFFSIFFLAVNSMNAQELTQSVRGKILDSDTRIPAIGATVVVLNSDPFIGASTDLDGYFKLDNVPVGRINIEVSYIGYERKVISNILVNSGKENFLTILITESINQLEEFAVVANSEKDKTINEMALMSSRQFSTEETQRYAGTLGDPAHMAGNFAGASNSADGNNDIVVRGNSPRGILWRMEGIEIPNPNHFAAEGGSGGAISVLNTNLLSNSDFLTGAFAPEYGNATSGVFDLNLRQGNNEKREYTLGVGMFGTDFTVEGPFKKGGRASYLANYRYSSLALIGEIGLYDMSSGIPKYQDGSFNFYLPTAKAGVFKVFGFGGLSNYKMDEPYSEDNDYIISKVNNQNHVAFSGISHSYILNKNSYIKSSVSVASNGAKIEVDDRINETEFRREQNVSMNKNNLKFATTLHKKLNSRNKISTGVIYTNVFYDQSYQKRMPNDEMKEQYGVKERSSFHQVHGTWKHRFNEKATVVSGLHFLEFGLNNSHSIEPRIAFNYQVRDNQVLTAGFGVHSKIESLLDYTTTFTDEEGNDYQPNKDLKLPKANHYIIGYDYQFAQNTHIKTEVYYQHLYDIPVENDATSNYSTINQKEWSANKVLVSKGEGRNYGVEVTLERFFSNNFYYLFTASVFESQYKTLAGNWEKTRYNGNYNSNFLIGKELKLGKNSTNKSLLISVKSGIQGGNRYNPIDLNESIASGEEILLSDNYSEQRDDILYTNFSAAYKVNRKKSTHEFKLEILNITNNQAIVGEYYDENRESLKQSHQWPMLPNILYTVNF